MDDLLETLADFATGRGPGSMTEAAGKAVALHLADGIGCAFAGAAEAPARVARAAAAEVRPKANGASAIGMAERTTAVQAAFVNGVAMRCLDFNDTYNGRTGGHPSDMISGILAAAEREGRPGRSVVEGIYVAYEIFGALADIVPLRELGIDQGVFIGPATAGGIAACLGMDRTVAANAMSLAMTTTVPLRTTRSGALSEWKGCATGYAAMTAVQVADLAARGMTAPPEPFRGVGGLFERIGMEFDLGRLGQPVDGASAVERTSVKFHPVEFCAQAPVEVFMRLHDSLPAERIASIHIAGYDFLSREIGGGRNDAAAKWDPQTRETADHSLPYLLAVTVMDGAVTLDSFRPERVRDAALRPLMNKITVSEDPAFEGMFPPRQPVRITIRTTDGQVLEEECEYAVGHPMNPGEPADITAKFRRLAGDAIGAEAAEALLAEIVRLSDLPDVDPVMRPLRAFSVAD